MSVERRSSYVPGPWISMNAAVLVPARSSWQIDVS